MAKHFSPRGLSIHLSYTVEEAALIIKASPQTVRKFELEGLRVLKGKIPHIIRGADLILFLEQRKKPKMPPLNDGEFGCMRRCKYRGLPFGLMADYIPTTNSRGRLAALCGKCEGSVSLFVGTPKLEAYAKILEISVVSNDDLNCTPKP